MITANVLQRTFRIKYGNSCGTCFTIDEQGKQYVITARHVVNGINESDQIEIFYNSQWHPLNCTRIGVSTDEIDITVLAVPTQLSPPLPLPATTNDITFGQDAYFLGFPYNLFADMGAANRNFPLPFIKRATLSSIIREADGTETLYLDGHNNPGFSGGPVVFTPLGIRDLRVAAVISGYRYEDAPIYAGNAPTPLAYRYNTGIIISYSIRHAIDLIQANPIGLELP